MAEREVRYCTTEDGVRIAYCVEGEGPALIMPPFSVLAFSLNHLAPAYDDFVRRLGEGRTLVQYDQRGTGLSQRDVDEFSEETARRDLEAAVDAAGLDKFSFWGMQFGALVAIDYATRHPGRVQSLVLYASFAKFSDAESREMNMAFADLARANWEVASRTLADVEIRRRDEEIGLSVASWWQQSCSGETFARLAEVFIDFDATPLLAHIACPTLVLHRRDDARYAEGQQVAAAIPGARFVPLPDGAIVLDDNTPVLEAIDRFLPRRAVAAPPSAPFVVHTILFTDLVGHTEMMQRLGDEQGRAVLREHERITREVLKAHGGVEVKTMGDGFMASFASVTKALECAIALQRAFAERNADVGAHGHAPLHVRVGLNAGEPIAEEGDLFGSSVILASRVAAQAGAGEILIPQPVRHLLAGKDFLFADRGEVALKGFEDAVRLYEVRWREEPS